MKFHRFILCLLGYSVQFTIEKDSAYQGNSDTDDNEALENKYCEYFSEFFKTVEIA
jgi:hypothetical protein